MGFSMKAFLIAVLFAATFATHVNGQGPSASGGGAKPGTGGQDDMPGGGGGQDDMPGGAGGQDDMSGGAGGQVSASGSVDASGVKADGAIDIEGIKCLCKLQASISTDGTAEASASGGGDCGLGDPAPTLSIDCNGVLNGKVDGAFFYILEAVRTSIRGYSSFVTFDKSGWEVTALNFPKGLSESNDLAITTGVINPNGRYNEKFWDLAKQNPNKLSLCSNTQTPGTFEYNLVEMTNQVLLDGRGCPLEEGAKTSKVPEPPEPLPPAIYQFPEILPCGTMSWDVKATDPDNREAFAVWFDFETTKGLCKPDKQNEMN